MAKQPGIDKELMRIYSVEALDLLERFGQSVLVLEKEPDNTGVINELFRIAHSLKGTSGMVGYEDVKESMHMAEDLLDGVRSGKLRLSSEQFDRLLALGDAVVRFIKDPASGFSKEDWVEDLQVPAEENQVLIDPPLVLTSGEKKEIGILQEKGKSIYGMELEFEDVAPFRSATAMVFVNYLQEYGSIYKIAPSKAELIEENFCKIKVVCILDRDLTDQELERLAKLPVSNPGIKEFTWRKWAYHPVEAKSDEHEVERSSNTIRVDSLKLQKLINTVGDLISVRAGFVEAFDSKLQAEQILKMIKSQMHQFDQTVSTLQSEVMQLRMVPIQQLFARFPRIVRDLAHKSGKEIALVSSGESTEIDKKVMELLVDPMTHLIRNAIDHGIEDSATRMAEGKKERGVVTLAATQEGNNIVIEIIDDGRGINLEKVLTKAKSLGIAQADRVYTPAEITDFIFAPGFSTADTVTDVSGRGVGLDVVRNNLNLVNGMVAIHSEEGKGTTFRLSMPLTLAIINAFLVKIGGQTFALPSHDVVENIVITPKDIHQVEGLTFFRLRDEIIPLQDLRTLFYRQDNTIMEHQPVVVIGGRHQKTGLIVEDFIEHREVMIKPINAALEAIDYVSGVTILGNGQICLIVDTIPLLERSRKDQGRLGA